MAVKARKIVLKAFLAVAAQVPGAALASNATIWLNGPILTMEGDKPTTAPAVVVRDGMIVFVGDVAGARSAAGRNASIRNLRGATLLPGFIDAHSHFALAMQMAGRLDLTAVKGGPPRNFAGVTAAVADYIRQKRIPAGGWVIAMGYDHEALDEHQHVTRAELDAAFPDYKVVLLHRSGHGMVVNGPVLALAGLTAASPTPEGGVMVRDASGDPNGVLFERAMFPIIPLLPVPTQEEKLAALDAAQQMYLAEGYVQAQDGATNLEDLAFFTSDAVNGRLTLDLVLLPMWTGISALLGKPALNVGTYQGHVKIEGIKFVLDGSPQARTAFFTCDYANGAPDGSHPWHGQPITSRAEFLAGARKANDRDWQLFVHANGDAAIDMAISVFDELGIKAADDRRPVVIHSQFQRPDQLAAYARIGVTPAYFTNHTYYWADVHRTNFDASVVDFISPMRAAQGAGLIVSNHTDYPVTPLDTRFMIWSAMTRTSKTGVVSGLDQRLDAWQALQALSSGPAWQVRDEGRRGRIRTGLRADFVVLDRNPLDTPVQDIRAIKVMETVIFGKTAWSALAAK